MKKLLHNSLRALFLSLAVLLSLPMLAEQVEIDGINYDLNVETKQATVIAKSSGKYSGEIVIHESVEHEGVTHSVTSIGDEAFYYCSGLTSVTIPNSVTSIGERAFHYCYGLTSVRISDIAAWCNIDFSGSNPLSYAHHLYLNGEVIKDLVIPNSVTSIGRSAFSGYYSLTSVTIPNSVTSIGYGTFSGCSGLTSVAIPNSVTSIGNYAFSYCSALTSVTIPNSVTSIGDYAFDGCHFVKENFINNSSLSAEENNYWEAKLHDYETEEGLLIDSTCVVFCRKNAEIVTIPNSVTRIGNGAFDGCSGLTSVIIPNGVTSIGIMAFRDCSGLTSVAIPNSVTSIGQCAFDGCSGLTSVTIGNSVTSIGSEAFRGCSGLTSVTIPNSVTSIGISAFAGCSGLTSVTIPNSVTSIGNTVFSGCSGLTSVSIPNSVTSIGSSAFYRCSGLTSVTIPSSVTSIGSSAFSDCFSLTSVRISDIAAWCNIDFVSTYSNPLYYAHHLYMNGEEVKDLVIPNSVTSIGGCAFSGCSALTSVTIPNSVTSIGSSAFYGCSGLTSVTIPNSVTSIGSAAFSGCSGLTSVTIPNSVTSIGSSAFYGCSGLASVTIGNSVTSIEYLAFYGCSKLQNVYCYAENVPSTKSSAFDGSYPENATLHVPDASIDSYKASAPWSSFGKIVALPNEFNLSVSSVGYATLFLDFNAEIPANVQAYTGVKVVDNSLKMERIEGVLPANTGVIIKADEGTYTFAKSDATPVTIDDNLLYGTVATTQISTDPSYSYYVLSEVDGIVGMYLAKLTDGKFQNNANKAYMMLKKGDLGIYDEEVDTGTEQLSRGFVFDFGEETSIDELKGENEKRNSAVYNLSGRRVQKAQKGIFIQNGKVVMVR